MRRTFLWSKVHRATVTETDVTYEGSLTLDSTLMEAAQMHSFEKIDVYDIENGERFSTYLIPGEPDSGICCVNGAAARKTAPGNRIILACYAEVEADEIANHRPRVVLVDEKNRIKKHSREIIHGTVVG